MSAFAVTFLCCSLLWAEPKLYESEGLSVDMPPSWSLTELIRDDQAVIWSLAGAGGNANLTILSLDSSDEKAALARAQAFVKADLGAQGELGFVLRARSTLPMSGCLASVYVLQLEEQEERVLTCMHPLSSHLYVWHYALSSYPKNERETVFLRFATVLRQQFLLLDAQQQTLPLFGSDAPAAAPQPPAAPAPAP
jgi:hypothetical protein